MFYAIIPFTLCNNLHCWFYEDVDTMPRVTNFNPTTNMELEPWQILHILVSIALGFCWGLFNWLGRVFCMIRVL